MKKTIFLCLVVLGTMFQSAEGQSITAAQILQKMREQFEPVKDYIATVSISLDMERLQAPEMPATIYFKMPDKVHVDAKNFAMLPRQAIPVNPTQWIDKFDATLSGTEHRGDSTFYKLRLVSKPEKGKPAAEIYVWIDGTRWVATRIEASPWELRKASAELQYQLVDNKVLLPSRISVVMDTQQQSDSTAEKSYTSQRMPRKGSIVIHYTDYKLNTNFSDEIFEKKKGSQ